MAEMDDETRVFLDRLFGASVPRDVVPGKGLTREDLIAQNAAVGTAREVTVPGEVLLDPDGMPLGVGPSHTETVCFGGAVVTRAQLDRLGLTSEDVPNLTVFENPKETDQ